MAEILSKVEKLTKRGIIVEFKEFINRGNVVTKETLLSEVWEIDFKSSSTVVDTYISYLRRKLHIDGYEGIKTVRGIGFQIVAEG